ncbi:hypothetical protein GTZ89_45110 [Streptomyces sp. SID8382]|uniref:hypothetical protein n=1 Tax=Streptomyces malaysiensis TaxID=92644 RepID=UPI0013318154|nr:MULTISPECIES: hypothetical protein [unclassified Streptomyces]MYX62586.1 hypothetical protein [Streptomyces sp. SID8382]
MIDRVRALTDAGFGRLRVPVADHGELGHDKEDLRSLNSFVQLVHLANLTGIARSLVVGTAARVQGHSRASLHAPSDKATQDPDVLGMVGRLYAYRVHR